MVTRPPSRRVRRRWGLRPPCAQTVSHPAPFSPPGRQTRPNRTRLRAIVAEGFLASRPRRPVPVGQTALVGAPEYDAVVVGAGPNGLTAAALLAAEGRRVIVFEAASRIGGGAMTDELTLPGFRHDVCSAIHPLAAGSPAFAPLDLAGPRARARAPGARARPSARRRERRRAGARLRRDRRHPRRRRRPLAPPLRAVGAALGHAAR